MPLEVFSANGMRDCGKWTGYETEMSKWQFAFSGKMDRRKCVACDEKVMAQLDDSSGRVFDVRVVMSF